MCRLGRSGRPRCSLAQERLAVHCAPCVGNHHLRSTHFHVCKENEANAPMFIVFVYLSDHLYRPLGVTSPRRLPDCLFLPQPSCRSRREGSWLRCPSELSSSSVPVPVGTSRGHRHYQLKGIKKKCSAASGQSFSSLPVTSQVWISRARALFTRCRAPAESCSLCRAGHGRPAAAPLLLGQASTPSADPCLARGPGAATA